MTPLPSPSGSPLPPGVTPLTEDEPRRVGPFRIVGRLGSGGMGVVYAALDDRDRRVAVKRVHRVYAEDADFRARFAREVTLVRRVRAACVPRFVGADTRARVPWLATEYVPGPTLQEQVRGRGVLTGASLVAFAVGVAEALSAIHGVGVVHRDVKPGNVILSSGGPRVLDFGIARAVEETALTRTGGLVGTPGWISPEQYGGAAASDRSDVFAWAGLVCFAATGHGPFDADNTDGTISRILSEPPRLEGVPTPLCPLLGRALAKDPTQRPGVAELLAETARLLPAKAPTAVAPSGRVDVTLAMGEAWSVPSAPGEALEPWLAHAPRRRPWALRHRSPLALGAAVIALVVLASGGAGLWMSREGTDGDGREEADAGAETEGDVVEDALAEDTEPEETGSLGEIPEDIPEEYRELYESGTVVVEPTEGDAAVLVRKIVSEDGREELEEMRITAEWLPMDGELHIQGVEVEYLLDFGQAEVRTSDFGWSTAAPAGEFLEFERQEQSSIQVVGPDQPTSEPYITTPDRADLDTLYYLPREVTGDDDQVPADYPGVLPSRTEIDEP